MRMTYPSNVIHSARSKNLAIDLDHDMLYHRTITYFKNNYCDHAIKLLDKLLQIDSQNEKAHKLIV